MLQTFYFRECNAPTKCRAVANLLFSNYPTLKEHKSFPITDIPPNCGSPNKNCVFGDYYSSNYKYVCTYYSSENSLDMTYTCFYDPEISLHFTDKILDTLAVNRIWFLSILHPSNEIC